MTQSQHTSGPWEAVAGSVVARVPEENGSPSYTQWVCSFFGEYAEKEHGKASANADLIAAAPELLEILTDIITDEDSDICSIAKSMALQLIAKATGDT